MEVDLTRRGSQGFDTIEAAVKDIRAGRMVVVLDDEDRENEGDLVMAAERVTPEAINFMARHARGLICVPLTRDRLDQLMIPSMVPDNTDQLQTAFTVSVDAKKGTTTGISAADRSATVRALIDPYTRPEDLSRPGHIFPLRAREGGVLVRAGHTEASLDLARLAGLAPAGVICEIMSDDGTMARAPELHRFARHHRLRIVTIKDLIRYRQARESLIERVGECSLPTRAGTFRCLAYRSRLDQKHHVALVHGEVSSSTPVLVRVHSECLTGDVFGSLRCDCGSQLEAALDRVAAEGAGVVVYLRQEGRGIGLVNKIRAYALQEEGLDTVDANLKLGFKPDLREYGIGAQILRDLGVKRMVLLTNNPKKLIGLEGFGLEVTGRQSLSGARHAANERYLAAKRDRLGHLPEVLGEPVEQPPPGAVAARRRSARRSDPGPAPGPERAGVAAREGRSRSRGKTTRRSRDG